jgi:hypothetical protein
VTGIAPQGETPVYLPGSTSEYFGSLLFQGWLESLDGSVSVPLLDPQAAALLGQPSALLVRPGLVATGSADPWDAAVITASLSIPPEVSEALFAGNVSSGVGARIRLLNIGGWFTVGGEPGHTVRDAVSVTGITGEGPVQTGGITGTVLLENPEPSTIALFGIGLALIFFVARRARVAAPSLRRPQGPRGRD